MADRFLVVEDDAEVSRYIATLLRELGHDVWTASTLGTAREIISTHSGSGDFRFIVDVMLQLDSGLEFVRDLLELHSKVRILIISGLVDELLMPEPSYAARVAFLPKPFSPPQLRSALQ